MEENRKKARAQIIIALHEQEKLLKEIIDTIKKNKITYWMGKDTTNYKQVCESIVFDEMDVVQRISEKCNVPTDEFRDLQHSMIDVVLEYFDML